MKSVTLQWVVNDLDNGTVYIYFDNNFKNFDFLLSYIIIKKEYSVQCDPNFQHAKTDAPFHSTYA